MGQSRYKKLLPVLALLMVLTAGLGTAWAYFTTYAMAQGGYTIKLGDRTQIEEEFYSWTKRVTVTSDEESEPVYIRVKAFCGSAYELQYIDEAGNWSPGADGYYYYAPAVAGGESTSELLVKIGNIPEEGKDGDSFNVAVIYESTPVHYDTEGNPYADWDGLLDTGRTEGGGD